MREHYQELADLLNIEPLSPDSLPQGEKRVRAIAQAIQTLRVMGISFTPQSTPQWKNPYYNTPERALETAQNNLKLLQNS